MKKASSSRSRVLVMYRIPKTGLTDLFRKCEVTYPQGQKYSKEELSGLIVDQDGLLSVFGNRVSGELIDKAPNLRIISNYGAGVDNIDIDHASKKGILVTNTPDAVTLATAELTIGLILAVMRRIGESYYKLRSGKPLGWGVMDNLGTTLQNKRLGIVGLGRIGREVARISSAFGMERVYFNRKPLPASMEGSMDATFLPLEELLATSDVVSLHTPLTPETYHLITDKELGLMKKTAILINTARGPVVDEEALIRYLADGKLAGAGLDVFEHEPHIPEALLSMDKVVVVPHIGTATHETRHEIAWVAAKNLIDYFSGRKPRYMVNPEIYRPINH